MRWNGQFSPQLIQVLLNQYARPKDKLFDPFLGSGTVLFEAGRVGLAACGTEINPAAIALAQTYCFINVPIEQRRFHLNKIAGVLQREFLPTLPLFPDLKSQDTETVKTKLIELLSVTGEHLQRQALETLVVLLDFYKPDLSTDKVFT